MKRFFQIALIAIGTGVIGGGANAQSIECDTVYRTKSGDSLSRIAGMAYGRTTAYQPIFDYNPGVLKNPSRLPANVELYIPCIEGGGNRQELAAIVSSTSSDIKILTGSQYPPYVDEGLPEGGFSVELIKRAMQYGDEKANYDIDIVNDWAALLDPLLSGGAYDLSFPWFRPDCSQYEKLGEKSKWRCDNLLFSEGLHDVVVTFYGKKGVADTINAPSDAMGMKICRPRGFFTHDLEVMGLTPPEVVMVAAANAKDCFERLKSGEVDLVSVNADTSDNMISELQMTDSVSEVINLASVHTLRVVGMKTNPNTRILLLRLNKGLVGLNKDGTFRALAAKHLR